MTTTTFNPQLAPALLADPAHRCAATLPTAMTMSAVTFDRDSNRSFQQDLAQCSGTDVDRICDLLHRLAVLSADVDAFQKDCRARVLADQ